MPGDRMRKDVEEILEKEERRSDVVRMGPPRKGPAARSPGVRLTPGALMLGGLALVLAGLVFDSYRMPLVLAALGLFSAGYVWSMRRRTPRGGTQGSRGNASETYWRGEPVAKRQKAGVVSFREPLGSRVRRWFRRK